MQQLSKLQSSPDSPKNIETSKVEEPRILPGSTANREKCTVRTFRRNLKSKTTIMEGDSFDAKPQVIKSIPDYKSKFDSLPQLSMEHLDRKNEEPDDLGIIQEEHAGEDSSVLPGFSKHSLNSHRTYIQREAPTLIKQKSQQSVGSSQKSMMQRFRALTQCACNTTRIKSSIPQDYLASNP